MILDTLTLRLAMATDGNLDQMAFFDGLTPSQRSLLIPYFYAASCPAEATIFTQNSPAEYLYLLVSGEVLIRFKPDDGPELIVSRVQAGGIFGWSAALGNARYTSSAASASECQMLRIHSNDLQHLCRTQPELGKVILDRLASVISERLSHARAQVYALLEYGLGNQVSERKIDNGNAR